MRRAVIAALAAIMAVAASSGACAQGPTAPLDDGTGSQLRPQAWDKPRDAAAEARYQAKSDRQRQDLARYAAEGHVKDMVNLATLLEDGDLSHAPDRAAAYDLFEKAADAGNVVGQQKMCIAYLLGEDRPLDVAKGMMAYCNKLGTKGAVALWAIGHDYQYGISGPKDEAAAMDYYVQAMQAGSGEAAEALGRKALDLGKIDAARMWFRQGVYRGSADAMDDLARMAETGQGGPKDADEAYWLYVNAARRGNAHAREWIKALPAPHEPLIRMAVIKGGKATAVTDTYKDKSGATKTDTLDAPALGQRLQGYFPTRAYDDRVEGSATVHCYIGADHHIDVCLISNEFPLGYDFGRVLGSLYDGQLTVPDQDVAGQPTAHTVFALTLQWLLG